MRRGLLIVLTFVVILSALPVAADGPSTWQGIASHWWHLLSSLWAGDEDTSSPISDISGKNLPYLDPNGISATSPSGEDTDILPSGQTSDDGNTLPYLDPNG